MSKNKKESIKVADLIIYCNENDSQQYLVYDLKYGENIIGRNSSKCSIVCRFTNDIDEVHSKICIDDDDYTIEDLGSLKGTFKIKNDNSLIRLKPLKSYDLSNNQAFYIGKFKCLFQIVKKGRGMAFQLNPQDLLNSQKDVSNNNNNNSKKGLKKAQSIEDDIEDYTGLGSSLLKGKKQQQSLSTRQQINKLEAEHIEEDEEENQFYKQNGFNFNQNYPTIGTQQKNKAGNTQKSFVKSKGQLSKGLKGGFKNDIQEIQKKDDPIDLEELSDQLSEEDEFQFSFPKSFKKQQEENNTGNRKRANNNKKIIDTQQEEKEEDSMKLDSQFLKRIQEKLKNQQLNDSRQIINDLANKYSSQKRNSQMTQQQKSQDLPFENEKQQPQQSKDNDIKKTTKSKANNVKEEKEKEKSKENSKDSNTKNKKNQKIELKQEEKVDKIKQQLDVKLTSELTTSKISDQDSIVKQKSDKSGKEKKQQKLQKNTKKIVQEDSTSISNQSDNEIDDEDYQIKEEEIDEEELKNEQKVRQQTKVLLNKKRKADELLAAKKFEKQLQQLGKKVQQISEKSKETKGNTSKKEEESKSLNKNNKKSEEKIVKQKETPKKSTKKSKIQEEEYEDESEEEEKIVQKTKKQNKNDNKTKQKEALSTPRRSNRNQMEEEHEEEEIIEQKTLKKSTSKASVTKQQPTKKVEKQQQPVKNDKQKKVEKNNVIEVEERRRSTRNSVVKDDIIEKLDNSKQNKTQKKQKESLENIDKTDKKKKVKEQKSDLKVKNPIRRTKGSQKKEVLQLQQSAGMSAIDIPRRNKYRIMFSNSSTTEEEKKQMIQYGAKILNDFNNPNDFNILITDEFKRRLKTLVALNKGYPIVSNNWIKQCIKQDKLVPYEPYIITKVDKALAQQHNFNLNRSLKNQKDHPEGIFSGITFVGQSQFDNISRDEVRKLVESGGGIFSYDKKYVGKVYCLSDNTKIEYNQQLSDENLIALDIEGLFQTCLLQYNVLDDYIITVQDNKKKSTTKRKN